LSLKDIFLAIAQKVKNAKGDFIENPYKTWNEINAKLPNLPIRMLIPSKAHGTRDAFEKMVMHEEKVRIGPEVREITDYEAAEGHQ
jgi:phosphate transport system substrate-binding protein